MKKLCLFICLSLIFVSKNAYALMADVKNGIACSSKSAMSNALIYASGGDDVSIARSGCVMINGRVFIKDYGMFSSVILYQGRTYYIPSEFLKNIRR